MLSIVSTTGVNKVEYFMVCVCVCVCMCVWYMCGVCPYGSHLFLLP